MASAAAAAAAGASSSSSSAAASTEDIRKMGQLVKIKTNKKKFFVLRDETKSSSTRLEYYDNEKKWRNGSLPKRTIVLKNCFNINAKPDAKHKHAIALYTKDDCFAISCPSEDEQQDWLTNMIELRNRNLDEDTAARPLFEHIWPVTVKSRCLGSERKVIPGQYRLCLTNKELSLIRVNNDQSDVVLPLDCIRRCGHTNQFFFLELGRSAVTGSGSLWLQVEDTVISQNIHEALLSSMKKNEVPTPDDFRPRSSSTMDRRKQRSSKLPSGGSLNSHAQVKRLPFSTNPSPDGTIKEEPVKPYMTINPVTESQSVGHLDAGLKRISEFITGSDGLKFPNTTQWDETAVFHVGKSTAVATGSLSSRSEVTTSCDGSDYVPMVTPAGETYMTVSARRSDNSRGLGLEARGSTSSVSSVISSIGSTSAMESSERSFHSLSHLQEFAVADGGYIEMSSPQTMPESSSGPVRPDIVPCYVRDENAKEFPKRAYSVGSKPVLVTNKPLNDSYIDMLGKSDAKKETEKSSSAPHLNNDDEKKRELSDLFMELDFNRPKHGIDHKGADEFRGRTSSGGSRELRLKAPNISTKDAFQRLSVFSRNKSTAGQYSDTRRPRTSTICQESLRSRTSSFGPSDPRPRSSSGGNACSTDAMLRQLQVGPDRSSHDSLRRHSHSKRSSQESVESGKSDAYMNMSLGKRSTDRLVKTVEDDAGYMDMNPSEKSNYMRMMAGTSDTPLVTTAGESATARASLGVMRKQKLETVKAGSGEDYLEMMPGSSSQSQEHGAASAVQSKAKVARSVCETSTSSYMAMTPLGALSEKTAAAKSEKKEVPSVPKTNSYMEMSLGSRRHGASAVTSSRALTQSMNERAKGSSLVLASSPNKDNVVKGISREQNASPKFDTPPPPFELSFPLQSFLLYADRTRTIPTRLPPASSSVPHATTSVPVDSPELPIQISYATLDLGSSVDDRSTAPRVEGKGAGVVGRGHGFGHGTHKHVYAEIDFEKFEDRQK